MRKLSSQLTASYKKVFPLVWFGAWGTAFVVILATGAYREQDGIVLLVLPIGMLALGYFLIKNLLWDLVDAVYDAGSHLVVKSGSAEHRIPFSDIVNVNSTLGVNPPRITLRLKGASAQLGFGQELSFSPQRPLTLNPFQKLAVAEELIAKVEAARRHA